jgi:predicted nucleotidyltransferase component of viral defense system
MIPRAYITEWAEQVPWQTNEQIEQDLVISRALVAIFSDEYLAERLAFRGGTALHKLYLSPQPRYSEDIDLVQITADPFGSIADRLRLTLSFLGEPIRKPKENNFTLVYRFESEFPPVVILRLKVETNCREHFSVLGYKKYPFQVMSSWFTGTCEITTYHLEELLGTKMRALYQRSKGRDLYDLYKALKDKPEIDAKQILHCFHIYMNEGKKIGPDQKTFVENLNAKMQKYDFIVDTQALLRPIEIYDAEEAYKLVKQKLFDHIDTSQTPY